MVGLTALLYCILFLIFHNQEQAMRQNTQNIGRRTHQEKRKLSSHPMTAPPSGSEFKKFRTDSCSMDGTSEVQEGKSSLFDEDDSRKLSRDSSSSELAARTMSGNNNPKSCPESTLNKKVATHSLGTSPGQSTSELVAQRAMLFRERGRSYLAHKRTKPIRPANVTDSTSQINKGELHLKQISNAEREKHYSTSEVAAQSVNMKSRTLDLSTSEGSSNKHQRVHLSTSEVAAENRRRLKAGSKSVVPSLHTGEKVESSNLSTSEVAARGKNATQGSNTSSSKNKRSTSERHVQELAALSLPGQLNKQMKKLKGKESSGHGVQKSEDDNDLKAISKDERRERRQIESEERIREAEMEKERRRAEKRAEAMRREEERLEERLREKKREEKMIEERIRDRKRAEEKRIEEEIIAQRIREKKREEKMIEERIREKRREEKKAELRLSEPRSTSEVAAKVELTKKSKTVDILVSDDEEDIVIEKVEQVAPSQMFPLPGADEAHGIVQRNISPPRFYNKLDSDSESDEEEKSEEDEVVAIREDLKNPPKRSTSEMFVENMKRLETSRKQWFEAPHRKTSDHLFENMLKNSQLHQKKRDGNEAKKVKDRVDEFLESCQRILPDADFPAVFKKISKYMSSISRVGQIILLQLDSSCSGTPRLWEP